MILGAPRSSSRSLASRSARSLLRQMRLAPPPLRMPAIMEAWFFSSERTTAAGQQLLQGRQRGVVGDIGRGEEQRRRLAVQVGELGLQLDVVVRGAGDVARAARAGAGGIERGVHGGEHGGVLAHAQIVVGAPHGDGLGAASGEAAGSRKLAAIATDVGEHPVAPLIAQRLQRLGERTPVIHHQTSRTLGGFPSPGFAVSRRQSGAILDEPGAAETPRALSHEQGSPSIDYAGMGPGGSIERCRLVIT